MTSNITFCPTTLPLPLWTQGVLHEHVSRVDRHTCLFTQIPTQIPKYPNSNTKCDVPRGEEDDLQNSRKKISNLSGSEVKDFHIPKMKHPNIYAGQSPSPHVGPHVADCYCLSDHGWPKPITKFRATKEIACATKFHRLPQCTKNGKQ